MPVTNIGKRINLSVGAADDLIPYDSGDLQYASAHTVAPAPPVSLEFIEAAEVLMMESSL